MKKVLIAIDDINKYEEIKNNLKNVEIPLNDIIYKEGILEILEINSNIDFIIIKDDLIGEIKMELLLKKIKIINKKIKIIFIADDKIKYNNLCDFMLSDINIIKINKIINDKENIINNNYEIKEYINNNLNSKIEENNKNIFYLNENNILNNNTIINKNVNMEKKEFLNNKNININNYDEDINLKKIIEVNEEKEKIEKDKNIKPNIITMLGSNGVGKSIFTVNIANAIKNKNSKILIIDFDILNNSLHTILGVSKYSEKIKNRIKKSNILKSIQINDLIIKINKNIDLISGINLLFDSKYKISSKKIKNILEELKKNYNIILIDTSSECFFEYTKEIINNSTKLIFLMEPNLIEIKKGKNLLNFYENEWNIDITKINIILNKINNISIEKGILKNIFNKNKIIGNIKYDKNINLLINKKTNKDFKKIKI